MKMFFLEKFYSLNASVSSRLLRVGLSKSEASMKSSGCVVKEFCISYFIKV